VRIFVGDAVIPKRFPAAVCVVLVCLLCGCHGVDPSIKSALAEKIAQVENGLRPPAASEGQWAETFSLADRMKHHQVPGVSVAVINNFEIEWAKGYGEMEADSGHSVTIETLFQAASISKPVAASAALHLVEQGLLDLDEDVNSKLHSWKIPENEFTRMKKVTLRHLLSHSGGLTVNGFPGYGYGEKIPSLHQILDGEKPANSSPVRVDKEPGSGFRYSGGGYTILQVLLEDVTGKPFAQLIQEAALDPLGMSDSTYEQPLPTDRAPQAATAHSNEGQPIKGKWHTYPEMAAAGLWTTPSDLARFALEIMKARKGMSNRLLSASMTKHMLTRQAGRFGLGFYLAGEGRAFYFGHGGSNRGFRCLLVALPETGQGVAVMTNAENGLPLGKEIIRAVATTYNWRGEWLREW
jgi:CubicO group peptidase (beta-lactamase class C family)